MRNQHRGGPEADASERALRDQELIQKLLGFVARVCLVVCVGAVIVASLIGAPRLLYSYHVSHFAVLYVLALAALAALPDWGALKTFWSLVAFVSALGMARVIFRHNVEVNFLDWIADLSGILGGLAPVVVQRLRELPTGPT